MKEITDHHWIGAKVKYNKVVGTIVAARTGGHMPAKGIRDKGEEGVMNQEAVICATVVEKLHSEGWIVACEVPIYYRHVDAVALKDGTLMAIEAKTSLTTKLMRQISSSSSAVDFSLAVVGATPKVKYRIEWCQKRGVGLWVVKSSEITEMLAPVKKPANGYKDSIIKSVLRCANSDTVGGLPRQKGIGEAQDVQRRVDEYRALHPKATWKEMFDHVPSHYDNYKNMYSALRSNAERLAFRARMKKRSVTNS